MTNVNDRKYLELGMNLNDYTMSRFELVNFIVTLSKCSYF